MNVLAKVFPHSHSLTHICILIPSSNNNYNSTQLMALDTFLNFLALFSTILSWPSFCLMYPIYASIRAIESDEESGYQQCLKYWVLFSIATIFEYTFSKILVWLSVWAFVRGICAVLLAVPSFAGASCLYTRYVQPHMADFVCLDEVPDAKDCIQTPVLRLGAEEKQDIIDGELKRVVTCKADSEATEYTFNNVSIKQVQREWSCPLCLTTTTSENCLRMHLNGKKHKAKQAEIIHKRLMVIKDAKTKNTRSSLIVKKLNRITWINYEKLRILVNVNRWATWDKPKLGWIKLNTDGSIYGNNSSFGGLLRDYQAKPMCAYHTRGPGDDIFLAELWAIWRGLVLASGLEIKAIWVESDSMSVVKTINKEQPYPQKASGCLKQIWVILKKFDQCRISHAWRETNRAADYLSRLDVSGSDNVIWPSDFPNQLLKIIEEDAFGRKYYRR